MDVQTAWNIVQDHTESKEDRADRALDVLVWLAKGGVMPEGVDRRLVVTSCELAIIEQWEHYT